MSSCTQFCITALAPATGTARPGRKPPAASCQQDQGSQRKAICCDGVLLGFVDGRPVSEVTYDFLAWLSQKMTELGKLSWEKTAVP